LVAPGPQVLGGPLRLGFRLALQFLPTLLGQRSELVLGLLRHLASLATGLPRQLLSFIRCGAGHRTGPLLRPPTFAVIAGRDARNLGRRSIALHAFRLRSCRFGCHSVLLGVVKASSASEPSVDRVGDYPSPVIATILYPESLTPNGLAREMGEVAQLFLGGMSRSAGVISSGARLARQRSGDRLVLAFLMLRSPRAHQHEDHRP
jgi:hypothetical protein